MSGFCIVNENTAGFHMYLVPKMSGVEKGFWRKRENLKITIETGVKCLN